MATNITTNSATLNGDITSLGSATSVIVSFEYGLTINYGSTTMAQTMTAPGAFSANITGLNPGTTYHFREKADGGASGIAYGPDVTFTTVNIPPGVSTSPASGITNNGATLNGNLGSMGTAVTVNVSFEYGSTVSYGSTTTAQTLTGTGLFNANIGGLSPGTAYHFRVKADSGIQGIAYGVDMTFTTTITPPSVSTLSATSIATNSVTLNGNLTSLGTAGTVNVSFEYGPTTSYGSITTLQTMTAAGTFSFNVNGLAPGTIYHYSVDADGGVNGAATGSDMTFVTANTGTIPPGVNTVAAASIAANSVTLNGNLTSLGTAGTVNGFFEYGLTTAYGGITTIQPITVIGTFSFNVIGLTPGATYHFRADADGGVNGTASGSDMIFTTTTAPPAVTTLAATSITANSTFVNGNLTSLGTASTVKVAFEYGLTNTYGSTTTVQNLTGTGIFIAGLFNLNPATTYHYRADVDGGLSGAVNGADMTFTTAGPGTMPPAVNTLGATLIATNSATVSGNLTSLGTASAVNIFFEYGHTTAYGSVTTVQTMNTLGTFSFNVTGLTPGSTYHFRAKVDGGVNGTATGSDLTFTTTTLPPQVVTLAATSITVNSTTLNGNLISLGTAGTVNVSFEYGTTNSYGSATTVQAEITAGTFNANLGGLIPATTYHFRIKADGGVYGNAAGSDMTFTTANPGTTPPAVGTAAATSIAADLASLNGDLNSLGTAGNR